MKQIPLLLVAVLALTTFSCCKKKGGDTKKDLIVVDIDRSDTTSLPFALPPLATSVDLSTTPFQIDTFATKVDEYITPYGFNKNQIVKVNLKAISLVLENAPSQTFNFIKDTLTSLSIYVDSFSGTTPQVVAFKVKRPLNVNNLVLDVNSTDIKDYFRSEFMKLLVGFRTQENEGVDASTKFRVNYTFTVTADPNL
ncbi:MAG TPA: hypothetical protein PLP34_00700 [Chitinophagaceae bacterium]|nr:hypothetical protein [Chitinophagaceae bacterium]